MVCVEGVKLGLRAMAPLFALKFLILILSPKSRIKNHPINVILVIKCHLRYDILLCKCRLNLNINIISMMTHYIFLTFLSSHLKKKL